MSILSNPPAARKIEQFDLRNGDQLTREEFHDAYRDAPAHVKAELIGGIVYVASPLSRRHAILHPPLSTVMFAYEAATLGVECGDNSTILLGDDAEPQPDIYLRVLPEYGGQSTTTKKDYVAGAPELVAEIAVSSHSIDLHAKRADYARHGVREYIVICANEQLIRWFDLRENRELAVEPDGICRMRVFPGLWLDSKALLDRDYNRLISVLQLGLASPEHGEFVAALAAARKA